MTSSSPLLRQAALVLLFCLGSTVAARADSVTLFPTADATMIGRNPDNSMGGGTWFSSGTTQNGDSNRALIKFDVANALPAGSTITSVSLYLWVVGQPKDGNTDSTFSLRRVLRPWGEGNNVSSPSAPGFGSPANPGDVTWTSCFHATNAWAIPGGLEGVDYSDAISSTAFVQGAVARYWFEAGGSVADVQLWLDHPEQNFGWLLKTEDESSRFTARRFGSRELEDANASPQLVIDFLPPLRIDGISTVSNHVTLTFNADVGYFYRVEALDTLAATNYWTLLTNYGLVLTPGPRTAIDSLSYTQRCYRLRRD